jgi:glycosyltransferase involved in cell wall biosynthesis
VAGGKHGERAYALLTPVSRLVSIVIPVLNEREALPGLLEEIARVGPSLGDGWEVIVVDDGSTDGTFELVERLSAEEPRVRGIKLRRNFGKSAALGLGFAEAQGDVIVTIDGDGQDDPADIPKLIAALDADADLVSGWKQHRQDRPTRRLASSGFNRVTSRMSGLRMHDMNCGLKAYRRECALSLPLYGEMHRFLPVIAAQQGWRVAEVPVNHRARRHGSSRFGRERYLRGALDLLTVSFLGRYQQRPLHLFGGIGLILATIGLLISLYLTVLKLSGEAIGERPLLFLGVLLIVVGVQLLSLGLLGQMLVTLGRGRTAPPAAYEIEREAGEALSPGGNARSATGATARSGPP